ncbi:hypothetical protein Emin_0701 [Elusimicrobium minutum Pei191]|uniref:PilE-like protein n=1 Tax=Elusimicrobium minutum (strain Pei191) TaxID=445932 RepID=B2KCL0_ELUMP|nr:hypothetical protein [Elusimicrobium minutum]ACC98256.1 hypothetical protein Emin_0701 [Elusimicrobium minutum Pei191]
MKKGKIGKIEIIAIILTVAVTFKLSMPGIIRIIEIQNAKKALANINIILDAQKLQLDNYGTYANSFKNLKIDIPVLENPGNNNKCNHPNCLHSGKYSYSYDNKQNLIAQRERSKMDLANYFFECKIDRSKPIYCIASNENAANICDKLGGNYMYSDPKTNEIIFSIK